MHIHASSITTSNIWPCSDLREYGIGFPQGFFPHMRLWCSHLWRQDTASLFIWAEVKNFPPFAKGWLSSRLRPECTSLSSDLRRKNQGWDPEDRGLWTPVHDTVNPPTWHWCCPLHLSPWGYCCVGEGSLGQQHQTKLARLFWLASL